MYSILIVEDSPRINQLIKTGLVDQYKCYQALDANQANKWMDQVPIDLVILDIMLPQVNGYELLPVFKEEQIPVIFLTAKTEVDDIVKGLRLGADDYITKPFHLDELAARVEAVLRRRYGGSKELSYEDFTVDLSQKNVKSNGKDIKLTQKEYELFIYLVKNRGISLSREKIYQAVWDFAGEFSETRTVDLHVQRL